MVLGRKCLTWILVVALALFSTGIVGCLKAHADEAGGEEEVGKELPAAEGPDDESASTGSDGLSSDRTSPAAEAASEDQAEPIQFDDDHVSVKLPSEGELDQTMAQLDEALLPSSSRSALAASTYSAGATMTVDSFSGALRFDTSAMEALAAFSSSEHAIIAGGEGWPDALAASTLAGALSCPIMLTPGDSLHGAVADALSQLGVNHVIVVGDKNAVSDEVVAQLGAYGAVERVSGTARYETQLAIYQYGLDKGLWASDFVIVANGGSAHFADALSASPFAYRAKAPVFFVADDGQLPAGQEAALVAGAKRGLFKKAVISDYISLNFVDRIFDDPALYSGMECLAAVYGYALQIYCDFSGYSDMAIGLALLLGFRFPKNFDAPYHSATITEFWRRWHISLSMWLRDYLYISLGGNRKGRLRTYFNLLVTMVLGGLWHGAAIRFVLWGTLHGVALALHKLWLSVVPGAKVSGYQMHPISRLAGILVTFHLVCFGWLLFRADSMRTVQLMLHQITDNFHLQLLPQMLAGYGGVFALVGLHMLPGRADAAARRAVVASPFWVQVLLLASVAWGVMQIQSSSIQPFIYFQF